MKKIILIGLLVFGCSHQSPLSARDPSSTEAFHSLSATNLIGRCRGMFKPSSAKAGAPLSICERSFTSADGSELCTASLVSSFGQFAKIQSSAVEWAPAKKSADIVVMNERNDDTGVTTYGYELNQIYKSSSSEAYVTLRCKILNLTELPKNIVAHFESRASSVMGNIVVINSLPTDQSVEGVQPAQ